MTLRLLLQIVPHGNEDRAYTIETINISNLGGTLKEYDEYEYVIEHNEYKQFDDTTPRVTHIRANGAWYLVWLALRKLKLIG